MDKLKELEKRIEALEGKEPVVEDKEWPQVGDKYFHLDSCCDIDISVLDHDFIDRNHIEIGNIYRTCAEAELALRKQKLITKLLAMSDGWREGEGNFFPMWDTEGEGFMDWHYSYHFMQSPTGAYFQSDKRMDEAMNTFTPEEQEIMLNHNYKG